jgi:hypothetical protein
MLWILNDEYTTFNEYLLASSSKCSSIPAYAISEFLSSTLSVARVPSKTSKTSCIVGIGSWCRGPDRKSVV